MLMHTRRWVGIGGLAMASMFPGAASGQVATYDVCSPGLLQNCALIRFGALGLAPGGNVYEVGIQNLGSTTGYATSIYALILGTGEAAAPGFEIDAYPAPVADGSATITDASPWSLFETGDLIFLSALGNDGVGGCVTSLPVGGFGQMANTCGSGSFVTFTFTTSRSFDPANITLMGVEFVAIEQGNLADSCNETTPCIGGLVIATPEPSAFLLLFTGLCVVALIRFRPRRPVLRFGALASIALIGFACTDIVSPNGSKRAPDQASLGIGSTTGAPAWLAPLGNGVANPATFEADAVTRVEICWWVAGACNAAPIAQFATVPAPHESTLRVNLVVGAYEADWSLMSTSLLTRRTYRIRALRGTNEVGAISVDAIRGRWALTRSDGTLAPLVAATTLPIRLFVPIVVGPAATLVLTTPATGAFAGAAFVTQPVVTLTDTEGHVLTSDNTTVVTMQASGPAASVVGTATATAQNGVATFTNVGVSGPNGYPTTLSFSVPGLPPVTQSMVIALGAAARISFEVLAVDAFNGSPFGTQPRLSVRDHYGTLLSGDHSTQVTVTVSAGASVVGQATRTATYGHVFFDNIGISGTPGTIYTLTYSSPGLTPATQTIVPIATAYVSVNGFDYNPGTVDQPLRSIQAATWLGIARVHVASGDYYGAVHLGSGTRIYGGFNETTWAFNTRSTRTSVLTAYANGPAIQGNDVSGVVIDGMTIEGGVAQGFGKSSYGMVLRNSSVTVVNSTIRAADGARGADGNNGADGSDGGGGFGGQNGNPDGGNGGGGNGSASVCGSWGGFGGAGGFRGANAGQTGGNGAGGPLPGTGGAGGAGGNPGRAGANGTGGASGVNGSSGPGGISFGSASSNTLSIYVPAAGGAGNTGQHGSGGGGGGGGGGQGATFVINGGGNGAGGGGAGGCGGQGSTGGGGGGGSFGIFSVNSTVTLSSAYIETGRGGAGGFGGYRGIGGNGGAGGTGARNALGEIGAGGNGGSAGAGGAGGWGGGGGGGPSIAVVSFNSTVTNVFSSFFTNAGGLGGSSGNNNGNPGLQAHIYSP